MAPLVKKINNFRFRGKVAAFDLDWTIIKPKSNATFAKDENDWEWYRPSVLPTISKLYKKGYCIMIFSNQTNISEWKLRQIYTVADSLGVPVLIAIATSKEERKPNTIMFDTTVPIQKWKKNDSFFVGDAIGRVNDFSNSDKVFAERVGFPKVISPEEMFPHETNVVSPRIKQVSHQEVVIMVGYPGSGKSTLATKAFGTNVNYRIVHGDEYKTSARMIKVARPLLENGLSVVFDATNPNKDRRAEYVHLANEYNLQVRCIHVNTSMIESLARNNMRPQKQVVPRIVYSVYNKKFEQPDETEGFKLITID